MGHKFFSALVGILLGKFFGALGVYTVALGFSTANIVVLSRLGDPDAGLMISTYLGYWLLGGAFDTSIGPIVDDWTHLAVIDNGAGDLFEITNIVYDKVEISVTLTWNY